MVTTRNAAACVVPPQPEGKAVPAPPQPNLSATASSNARSPLPRLAQTAFAAARPCEIASKAWQFRGRDILDSIGAIDRHVSGTTYEQFAADRKTVDAVIRNLTIIGEAAANVPSSTQERFPDVPWDEMRRMRDVVVHVYFGVDLPVVWRTIQEDLPPVKTQLIGVLRDAERDK